MASNTRPAGARTSKRICAGTLPTCRWCNRSWAHASLAISRRRCLMALDPKLVAQIVARPMDDAPRLVAADQLMEANDPRGDFIALQCSLARGGLSPSHRAELRRRERAHLAEHRAEWA